LNTILFMVSNTNTFSVIRLYKSLSPESINT
jgi:hypothetical protein